MMGKPKKADVAEHPEVFDHVGLLVNKPPGTGRGALQLVVRRLLPEMIMSLEDRKASEFLFDPWDHSVRVSCKLRPLPDGHRAGRRPCGPPKGIARRPRSP